MKIFSIVILLLLISQFLIGQAECHPTLDEKSFISNNYRLSSLSNIALLNLDQIDYLDPIFGGDGLSQLFEIGTARSIWAGGLSSSGGLKLAASTYGQGGYDYICGPIRYNFSDPAALCAFYKRVWTIKRSDIIQYKEMFSKGEIIVDNIPKDILEWPATRNPHIAPYADQFESLAPFYDNDNNGIYDPMAGDHPIVLEENTEFIPDVFRFYVINDKTNHLATDSDQLEMEFHVLDYGFNCTERSESEKSIFTRLKCINKGEDLTNFKIGTWNDPYLDCSTVDDFVGSLPELDANYTYKSPQSTDCLTTTALDEYGIVRSLVYLNTELESFIHYYNRVVGTTGTPEQYDPATPQGYYNYLNGKWRDGTNMTYGGTGLNTGSTDYTLHAFPDLPNQNTGWSMQTSHSQYFDIRTVSTFKTPNELKTNEFLILDFVDHIIADPDNIGLSVFNNYEEKITTLREEFTDIINGDFNCNNSSSTIEQSDELNFSQINFHDKLNIKLNKSSSGIYKIFSVHGHLVYSGKFQNAKGFEVPITMLASGLYVTHVIIDKKVASKKFTKATY